MLKKIMLLSLVLFLITIPVLADEAVTEEEKAEFEANFVVPPIDELFTALDSLGDINWAEELSRVRFDAKDKFDYKTDEGLALNLGIRVADAVVAVQVRDKEAVGELISNAEQIANKLNVSAVILEKAGTIKEQVKQDKWEEVLLSINDLQSDVEIELALRANSDLSVLATMAGWLEGLNVVSGSLSKKYDSLASTVLRQPGLIDFYLKELGNMEEETKSNTIVKRLINVTEQLRVLCDVPKGKAVPKDNIDKIYALVSDLANDITLLD